MDGLRGWKDAVPEILAKKPWITAEEGKDLSDKIEELRTWFDDKIEEQAKAGLATDPVITADLITQKVEKVSKLFKKVSEKKKPREKKSKDSKKEEQNENRNGDSQNENNEK